MINKNLLAELGPRALYTVQETAEVLGLQPWHIEAWALEDGSQPAHIQDGVLFIDGDSLRELVYGYDDYLEAAADWIASGRE